MQFKDILLLIIVTVIWGVNFSAIKLGLNSMDPFLLSALRFTLCAFPLILFIKKPDVEFKYLILYGLSFGIGIWGIVHLAIYFGISAGISSLILQMGVFFTVIMGYFYLKEQINLAKKISFFVAFIGLFLILFVTDGSVSISGFILVLIAALFLAISNIIVKKAKTTEILGFIIWSSLFSPIPLILLAYLTQGENVFINFSDNLDFKVLISVLFQVYPTTLFGYWVWNKMISKYPVSSVAPYGLLVPIFGLLGSYFIYNEQIESIKFIAAVLIILGLFINSFSNRFQKRIKNIKIKT